MAPHFGPLGPQPDRVQVRQILAPRLLMRAAPDKADVLREVVKGHRDRIDALRTASQTARREVLRLYQAPTFDKTAVDQALARMQTADGALFTEMLKVASESGALLSPEERKKVAEWQPRGPGFGARGGRGFDGNWQRHGGPPPPEPDGEPTR
jgi:hypothetical protein